ncbi:MAG TPA: signal peptidase I [Candidatus Sulfotelmatobacter sp.]
MDSPNPPIVAAGQPGPPPIAVVTPEPGFAPHEEPASAAPQPQPNAGFAADIVSSLQSLIGTIVIAIFVITFVVQAFQIPSESMENTLLVGDYLLVNKLCYGGRGLGDHIMPYQKISRGDVIVFHYPVDPKQHFVKRVIGVPGDRLRMVNKTVYINGKSLTEPYVRFLEPPSNLFRDNFPRTDMPIIYGMEGKWWLEMRKLVEDGELIIPQGNYFVMGDNRDDSQDSRYWGFVPRENIIGRPLLIYWSVKTLDQDIPSGKAYRFAYALTHLFQNTRWNRTLRLVH